MKGKRRKQNKGGKIGVPSSLARRQRLTQSPFRDLARELTESLHATRKRSAFEQLRNSIPIVVPNPLEQLRESMQAAGVQKILAELGAASPALSLQAQMPSYTRLLNPFNLETAFEQLSEQIRSFQPRSSFEQLTEVMKDAGISDSVAELLNSVRTTHSFQEIYDNIFIDSTAVNSVEESYKEVFTRFIIAESETGDADTAAHRTAAEVQSSVRSAPKNRLSFAFCLNLIISLTFLVFQLQLSHESEVRIIDESIKPIRTPSAESKRAR